MNIQLNGSSDWLPIALSRDIGESTAAPVVVTGVEVALWRDAKGTVHAWLDRCPHRGMRLSFGFVRGENLTCLYHGWRYAGDGRCRFIPAHPDLDPPKTITAEIFPCAEIGGLVWMRMGTSDGESAPPSLSPNAIPVRSVTIEVRAAPLQEQLRRAIDAPAAPTTLVVPQLRIASRGPYVIEVESAWGDSGWRTLIAALQPVNDHRTALHLLVVPHDSANVGAVQIEISRWAERLRRACEVGMTARTPRTEFAA